MGKMKTSEILKNLRENGGFVNWRNWTKKEIAEWIRANYICSQYVANKVAEQLR